MVVNLNNFLLKVEKPLRYIGKEWNSTIKKPSSNCLRIALAFPDIYEIGMSHIGLRILYSLINKRDDAIAERVFAPWIDMEKEMRERGLPLYSLETYTPLKDFDIIGFSLQYEMNYTNVLTMLDLSGLPVHTSQRKDKNPLVIAGGPAAFNPEPLADYIDLFVIGDGEEVLFELIDRYKELKISSANKKEILKELAAIEGIYVPSLYATRVDSITGLKVVELKEAQPIKKRIAFNLDAFPFPDDPIVPYCQLIHDRIALEIARGCNSGCRFCQAGIIYLPVRERNPVTLIETALKSIENTGYEEVSMSALNPGDFSSIELLSQKLMDFFKKDNISLSLSSIRPSRLSPKILEQIRRVKKTGFTLAPEAGTQRMRDVINKGITEEEILSVTENVFKEGWQLIKLYFMIGLPTEQMEDISGIAELTKKIVALGKNYRRPWINLSVSTFIPKPHSVFQWLPMERLEQIYEKQKTIKKLISRLPVTFKAHYPQLSFLEGVFSRGDRALSKVLESAWKKGCRFDGWGDQLKWDLWIESFKECGVSPELYLYQRLPSDTILPWDHISTGVNKEFLKKELELGLQGIPSVTCSIEKCSQCGVCPPEWIKNKSRESENIKKINETLRSISPYLSVTRNKRMYYRASFSKKGDMKYLSHLDFSRTILRAMRRAQIPLAYSQGFHPKPQVSFSPALALGVEAKEEFIDFATRKLLPLSDIQNKINSSLPQGIEILRIALRPEKPVALEQAINVARYSVRIYPELVETMEKISEIDAANLTKDDFWIIHQKLITDFLSKDEIMVARKKQGKEIKKNIKSLLKNIYLDKEDGKLVIELWLDRPFSVKSTEVIKELYPHINLPVSIVREGLFIFKDGKYFSPFGYEVKDE